MEAGKFFISLGLTGAEKTLSGLSQVNDHFSGLKGMAIESKLAILAALAGLEQVVSISGKFGNEITKNTEYLNIGKRALQDYTNATTRMGLPANSFKDSIQSIQDAMNDLKFGKGPANFMPTLFSLMIAHGEKFTDEEKKGQFNYWEKNPLALQKHFLNLNNLIGNGIDKGTLASMMKGANINMDVMTAGKMGAYSDANMKIAHSQSVGNGDISKLNQLNTAWIDIEQDMKKIIDILGVQFLPLIQEIANLAQRFANSKFMKDQEFGGKISAGWGAEIIQNSWDANTAGLKGLHVHDPQWNTHTSVVMNLGDIHDPAVHRAMAEKMKKEIEKTARRVHKEESRKDWTNATSGLPISTNGGS